VGGGLSEHSELSVNMATVAEHGRRILRQSKEHRKKPKIAVENG